MQKTALDVVLGFVKAINRHDVDGLVALMTEDHCFVDGLGQTVRGRERMEKGWVGYFGSFPDYCVRVDEILSKGNTVGLFGTAEGTYSVNGELLPKTTGKFQQHGRRWYSAGAFLNGVSMPITSPCGRSWA